MMIKTRIKSIAYFLIIFTFLINYSCSQKNDSEEESSLINIELSDKLQKIECSDILYLSRFVTLETNGECIIGQVESVIVNDSLIYVLDKEISKSVFIFNNRGKFLKKISKNGRGPNEYITLNSFVYDKYMGKLILLDSAGRKLLFFNKSGTFEKTITLEDYFSEVHVLDKEHFIFYSNFNSDNRKQFSIANKNGEIISSFKDFDETHYGWASSFNAFCMNNDTTLITLPNSKSIYAVKGYNLKPRYNFSFNGHFVNPDAEKLTKSEYGNLIKEINKEGKIITEIENLVLINDILYFTFLYLHQTYCVFYNTKNKSIMMFGWLSTDIDCLFRGDYEPVGQTSNELIFKLEPSNELERYERLKNMPEYKSQVEKYKDLFEAENFNLNSNPALLFFTIKNEKQYE